MRTLGLFAFTALLLVPELVIAAQPENGDPDPTVQQPVDSPDDPTASGPHGIQWRGLMLQSLGFLGLEHGFRYATEEGTRHPHRPFFRGYEDSLENLHGWSDGDPFLVNYVGHPMQGAVAGFVFAQNDADYRGVVFGRNRDYWKSRLRATAFSIVYSEQFEIGPLSEASIGNVQSWLPQQGFADQVVTPAIGMGWMIAEDAVDRMLIRRLEGRIENRTATNLLRAGLNPTRSLANMLAGRMPWYRDTSLAPSIRDPRPHAYSKIPTFQFITSARFQKTPGEGNRGDCVGGGATAALRLSDGWDLVGDIAGCKLLDLRTNLSGDSLTFMLGPRYTWAPDRKWQPYTQVLAGGRKMTWEVFDPVRKAQLEAAAARQGTELGFLDHLKYTTPDEGTGLALSAAAGLDLRLTSAIGLRLGEFAYTRSWHSRFEDTDYSQSIQFSGGLILRFGTW